jgi:hypothetical protein
MVPHGSEVKVMAKKLKIWNGSDWDYEGGHLYVAAYSGQDAINLVNEAYRKLKGYTDRPDIKALKSSYFRTYWSPNCWGNDMDGITPERGVWWTPKKRGSDKEPVRRIL